MSVPLFSLLIDIHFSINKIYQSHIKIPFVIHFYDTMPSFTDFYLDYDGAKKKVVQETINALKSMMSTNDVVAFSTLCGNDKIESLSGIREIVNICSSYSKYIKWQIYETVNVCRYAA